MILEFHNRLSEPQRVEATRLVVRCPVNGIVAIIVETAPHHIFIVERGDGDMAMNHAINALGIANTTVVSNMVDGSAFPKPPGRLWTPERV
jgi:hypothetical protein